ncbi:HoxN/HupN/NixA family nickel/cobalt transporter [Sinomonas albida]|uniref:HoxN/HupN/NixA family nickel/cobalt transporter n=1 Tax=Sinomonas albida TaxID=369942 RepID=UPI0010A77A94|nr:HoxN/HupN/NixA family nickel/cobalt transporter [Sinomonas albida]
MSLAVLTLHLAGWGLLAMLVLPALLGGGASPAMLAGLAVSAYALGVRHAFDADHIAAIDNATRRLVAAGQRPVSVGFWFALGHSTVVLGAVALVLAGVDAFSHRLADEDSALRQGASLWGSAVSGVFLLLAGALNLPSLRGMGSVLVRARGGAVDTADLERCLGSRGILFRALGPLARLVDAPWKMYPTGFLFGLGLDTAASVGLLAAGALSPGMPPLAALALPLLFTAGMTLSDSADGIAMNRIYRWASADTVRKAAYNLAVTAVSIAVAFLVGAVGLASAAAQLFGVRSGPLAALAGLDTGLIGMVLVAVFAAFGLYALARSSRRAAAPALGAEWGGTLRPGTGTASRAASGRPRRSPRGSTPQDRRR